MGFWSWLKPRPKPPVPLLAVLALIAGCAPIQPPPIPQPPPVVTRQANVSIYDEAGAQVTDATCTLAHDRDTGQAPYQQSATGWRESFTWAEPPANHLWGATLTCSSPSYLTIAVRYEPLMPGELSAGTGVVMKAAHGWGDEKGWLRRDGLRILTEDGREWRYRGYSHFQLLKLYCEGHDVDPLIEDAASVGARVLRVFGMFDPWLGHFTLARDNPAAFDACLLGLVRDLASHGLRIQFTVFADAQNIMPSQSQQIAHFNRVSALLANEWNVLGEPCNECSKNGVDPSIFSKPVGRVLWSRGSGLGGGDPPANPWDLVDYHEARDDEYDRKNECREYMTNSASAWRGWPCLQSEPMGVAEVAQPGRRDGAVGGNPQGVIERFSQMGANFGLQSNGGLCHAEAGITGDIMPPVQRQSCTAFFRGLDFAPTDAHMQTYQRGDNCGNCAGVTADPAWPMPIQQLDALDWRAYCRPVGGQEYCVVHRPGRPIQVRGGWQIVDQPAPGLVRLVR